jgi:rare lipoprotein A
VRVLALVLALVLAGCATPTLTSRDAAPRVVPRNLERIPDPVPRAEPRARYGNHSPYVVFGRTYHVREHADGYAETGYASWYGRKFHGRPTSSGEPYDMFALTAAHRSLPLPTYVRVTRVETNRSIVVRVNDRGPFHENRIIDLSYAAAVKLGFADQGVARVRVEAIGPGGRPPLRAAAPTTAPPTGAVPAATRPAPARTAAPAVPTAPAAPEPAPPVGPYWVQAGAFRDRSAAERLRARLDTLVRDGAARERADPARVELASGDDALVRVRVGPFPDLTAANRMQALITFADVAGVPLIVRD